MTRWLDVFLESPKASLFVRVDNEFISNSFNLFGLKPQIDNFNQALELIKKGPADSNIDPDIERDAMNLYGLLHARFLLTKMGYVLCLKSIKEMNSSNVQEFTVKESDVFHMVFRQK